MDVELRCEAEKCIYNLQEVCAANEIHVRGEDTMGGRFTFCSTFTLDREDKRNSSDFEAEFSKELLSFIANPEVECTAINCEYNQREICYAPHVKIVSGVSTTAIQTECQTFIPREMLYSL